MSSHKSFMKPKIKPIYRGSGKCRNTHVPMRLGACSAVCTSTVLHRPCHRTPLPHNLSLCGAGHDAQAVATAVATGLVAAYADLRQLQFLLQSLLDALLAQVPPTAAAVLCVSPFVQALQKVSHCIQNSDYRWRAGSAQLVCL